MHKEMELTFLPTEFSVQVLIQGSPQHGTQSEVPRPLALEPVRNVNSLAQPQTY